MAPIHIEMVSVPAPYQAAQVKVGSFPLGNDAPKLHLFFSALLQAAAAGLTTDVFLDLEFLPNGRDAFNAHTAEWAPQIGLGVWPDRAPPELWKITDLFRMARGEKIPLMYQVARVSSGPKASTQAFNLLFGSGMVVSLIHSGSSDEMLAGYKAAFLPNIKQPNLRIQPFYMPLLDLKSLDKRRPEELRSWLGATRLYFRESPGDNAILVITEMDLKSLLGRAGAKPSGGGWIVE